MLIERISSSTSFSQGLDRLVSLLRSKCRVFGNTSFGVLIGVLTDGEPVRLSVLFSLLRTVILDPMCRSEVFSVVRSALLCDKRPRMHCVTLRLLDRRLGSRRIETVFRETEIPFLGRGAGFIGSCFRRLCSSLTSWNRVECFVQGMDDLNV